MTGIQLSEESALFKLAPVTGMWVVTVGHPRYIVRGSGVVTSLRPLARHYTGPTSAVEACQSRGAPTPGTCCDSESQGAPSNILRGTPAPGYSWLTLIADVGARGRGVARGVGRGRPAAALLMIC